MDRSLREKVRTASGSWRGNDDARLTSDFGITTNRLAERAILVLPIKGKPCRFWGVVR